MDINDLMVGDLVLCLSGGIGQDERMLPHRVVGLHNGNLADLLDLKDGRIYPNIEVEYLEPILLTIEILDKNFHGYKRGSGYLASIIYELNEEYLIDARAGSIDFFIRYDDSEHAAHDEVFLVELRYVHILQHTLRLFGIDKEIVL